MVRNIQAASVQGRTQRAPGGIDPALDQRGDGEGKRHRKPDIAEVEERRMEGEAGVLQQRVQVVAR